MRLSDIISIYNAEALAIYLKLDYVILNHINKVVILLDCKSALKSINETNIKSNK